MWVNRFTVAGQRQIFTGFPCAMQKMFSNEHNQRVTVAIAVIGLLSGLFLIVAI